MTAPIVETPDLVTIDSLWPAKGPWRVRLQYVGDNPENKSGQSHKYWQITPPWETTDWPTWNQQYQQQPMPVEVRWGAIGRTGQSKTMFLEQAIERAYKKMNKRTMAYSYDSQTGQTQTVATDAARYASFQIKDRAPKRRTFRDRLLDTKLLPGDREHILDKSALFGWTRADVGIDVTELIPRAVQVNLYVDRENRWWMVVKWPDTAMTYGRTPSA